MRIVIPVRYKSRIVQVRLRTSPRTSSCVSAGGGGGGGLLRAQVVQVLVVVVVVVRSSGECSNWSSAMRCRRLGIATLWLRLS